MRPDTTARAVRAYLELLRPANIATALADVLAGYAVAGLPDHRLVPWLLVSTACLYGGGVVLNDVCDRDLDRIERPERPIPSGRASAVAAGIVGSTLLAGGVAAAWLAGRQAGWLAAAIAALVVLYDTWGKRRASFAPVNMGACRALNLLLGVAAAPAALETAWPLAGIPFLYIAAITALSRGEVHGGRRAIAAAGLVSLSIVLGALLVLASMPARSSLFALGLALFLGWRVVPPFWQAYRTPESGPIRSAVRTGVLSLVFVDASIGAAYGGAAYSIIILATALPAGWLARRFSVT